MCWGVDVLLVLPSVLAVFVCIILLIFFSTAYTVSHTSLYSVALSQSRVSLWEAVSEMQICILVAYSRCRAGGRWLSGKESACQCRDIRDVGSIPELERIPWKSKWQPTPVFLPGKSHGQRSLEGYSPWGRKELDTTDWACTQPAVTEIHTWGRGND